MCKIHGIVFPEGGHDHLIGQVSKKAMIMDVFHMPVPLPIEFMENRIMDAIEIEGFDTEPFAE